MGTNLSHCAPRLGLGIGCLFPESLLLSSTNDPLANIVNSHFKHSQVSTLCQASATTGGQAAATCLPGLLSTGLSFIMLPLPWTAARTACDLLTAAILLWKPQPY